MKEKNKGEAENGWEFWEAAKVTQIKRALRKGVATDNEERQKKTTHLREHLIEQDDNRRALGEANKMTDPGKVAERECVSARALQVTLVAVISPLT